MHSEYSTELAGRARGWRLAMSVRLYGLLAAAPAALLLLTAWELSPDPSGAGTHAELGLGRCSFLVVTGIPCPSCGMTTAFAAMAHGQLHTALRAQVFGAMLFFVTCAALMIGLAQFITGRNFLAALKPSKLWLWIGLACLAAGWIIKIAVGSYQ